MATRQVPATGIAIGTLALVIGAGFWSLSVNSQQAIAQQKDVAKLTELLQERLATRTEIAKHAAQEYQRGAASLEQLQKAEQARIEAELDLCETAAERIKLLEESVALARTLEKSVLAKFERGIITTVESLQAKANRLEAEIRLERARQE